MHQQGGTLAAHDISVHRGGDAVLERVSLAITSGSRIGVVGPNGRGKTTLLRALAGLEELDAGSISRNPPSLRVGYLPQERDVTPGESVLGYFARRTAEPPTQEFEARVGSALRRVGLDVPLEREVGELSGGERSRAALASILLSRFDVYLLDEPTNDLDFDGLELLERFVASVEGRRGAGLARPRVSRPDGRSDPRARGRHGARSPLRRRLDRVRGRPRASTSGAREGVRRVERGAGTLLEAAR